MQRKNTQFFFNIPGFYGPTKNTNIVIWIIQWKNKETPNSAFGKVLSVCFISLLRFFSTN